MKTRPAKSLLLTATVLIVVFGASPQRILATQDNLRCKEIDADQRVTVTSESTTTGVITRGGMLNGTTADVFTSAPLPTAAPDVVSITDTLTITTDKGQLTLSDVTLFAPAAGLFSSIARVSGGTRTFVGAIGVLFISGSSTDGIHFRDRIIGEICLAR